MWVYAIFNFPENIKCWNGTDSIVLKRHKRYGQDTYRNRTDIYLENSCSYTGMTSMADKLKLVVFLGSAREGRLADRVKKFVLGQLEAKNKYDIVVYDPIEKEFPILKKAFHYYEPRSTAPKLLQDADAHIQSADAFLLISCEYNHSIPPALSNMLDHFPASSFAFRPSGILTYSPSQFGGIRAAMQLRALTGELGCISVSKIFAMPKVHDTLDENGRPAKGAGLVEELDALMSQLDWVATAFKDKKAKELPPSSL